MVALAGIRREDVGAARAVPGRTLHFGGDETREVRDRLRQRWRLHISGVGGIGPAIDRGRRGIEADIDASHQGLRAGVDVMKHRVRRMRVVVGVEVCRRGASRVCDGVKPVIVVLQSDRHVAEQPIFDAGARRPATVPIRGDKIEVGDGMGRRDRATGVDAGDGIATLAVQQPVRRRRDADTSGDAHHRLDVGRDDFLGRRGRIRKEAGMAVVLVHRIAEPCAFDAGHPPIADRPIATTLQADDAAVVVEAGALDQLRIGVAGRVVEIAVGVRPA